jgi:hypothetical protein
VYHLRILIFVVIVYFSGHVIMSVIECSRNFCVGDRESDWIYEYTNDEGKRMVVVGGDHIPKEQYRVMTLGTEKDTK